MKHDLDLLRQSIESEEHIAPKHDLEALRASIMQDEPQKVSTVGEDISNLGSALWQGAKKLPGAAMEIGKNVAKNPGQAAAGLIPGITSVVDTPALLGNIFLRSAPEYFAEKYTGETIPEDEKLKRFKYYGHEIGTNVANKFAGKPKTPEEESSRLGGEIVGSLVNPGRAVKMLGNKAVRGLGKFSPKKYEELSKAGISPHLAEVTEREIFEGIAEGLENAPLAANRMKKAKIERGQEVQGLFEKNAGINEAKGAEEAGELFQQGAKAYNKKASGIGHKLYEKAWKGINWEEKMSLPKTFQTIEESLSAISQTAKNRLAKSMAGKELLQLRQDLIENLGQLPFADVKQVFKKDIDDLVKQWQGVNTKDQAVLQRISGALKEDMNNFTLSHNPNAAKDLAKADQYWEQYSKRNRKIANAAENETNTSAIFNNALSSLRSGDVKKFGVLTRRLPTNEKQLVSASVLNELGRVENGGFSAEQFIDRFGNMRPESQKALLAGYPNTQAKQIRTMIDGLSKAKYLAPDAKTIGQGYLAGALTHLSTIPVSLGLQSPLPVLSSAGTALATRGVAELFANPKYTKALYDASKATTLQQLNKILSNNKALPRMGVIGQSSPALDKILKQKHDPQDDAAFEQLRNE